MEPQSTPGASDRTSSQVPPPAARPVALGAVPHAPVLALERLPDVGVGIRIKLVVLMGAVTVAIVAVLASYFPARQIAELHTAVRHRAEVYAGVASFQLRSAVAFSDRETAREVLSSIAKDPAIDGVAVYSEQGEALHAEGVQSDLAKRCRLGLGNEAATFHLPGRILATAPIRSLEGARGTVVLELSTRSANQMRDRLVTTALGVGGAALLLGMLAAWLIARSLSLRVEGLTGAAAVISRGDFEHRVAVTGPNDELGVLAHAFNAMGRKLSELVAHIQRTAREQNARLETLVQVRTEELDRRNKDLKLVLDNVEQGFVTIDRAALVVGEYSLAIATWLGELDAQQSLWQQLSGGHRETEERFDMAWQQVLDGVLPPELTLPQMPKRLQLGARHLHLEYKPLGGEQFERLLVVLSDVTAVVAREHTEQESRDLLSVTGRVLHDRAGFVEFMDECDRLFQGVARRDTDQVTLSRELHTLKGNLALYGLTGLSKLCHQLETEVKLEALAGVDPSKLLEEWRRVRGILQQLLGKHEREQLQIDTAAYGAALEAIRRGAPHTELERLVTAWQLEPLRERLQRSAEQLTNLATSAGLGRVRVVVTCPSLFLARDELREFWSAFAHVLRNAIAYGLKSERESSAAAAKPDFALRAGIESGQLFVEIADFGRGIDWEAIRRLAKARGLPHATSTELEQALFAEGISTRGDVSELAGRGVGLGAVRAACEQRGGRVQASSTPGAGSRFRFSWPTSELPSLLLPSDRGSAS